MKERVFYYDALKAFSIFVVIMGHVLLFSFHEAGNIIWKFINVVNMAMFMFVSGLLSGKPSFNGLKKKFLVLIIPTVAVGLIYTLFKEKSIPQFFTNSVHFGYWFCLTLFFYHLFNIFLHSACKAFNIKGEYLRGLLLFMSVLFLLILSRFLPYESDVFNALSLQQFFNFLPYFAYGVFLNYIPRFKVLIETNNWIYTICLLLLFTVSSISLDNSYSILIIAFCYINVMVFLFHRLCMNRHNRAISYVAKRTLDIYLFHYFLLPQFIVKIPDIFDPNTNILYTLLPVIFISLLVLLATLVLTRLFERSKLLSAILLGKYLS